MLVTRTSLLHVSTERNELRVGMCVPEVDSIVSEGYEISWCQQFFRDKNQVERTLMGTPSSQVAVNFSVNN